MLRESEPLEPFYSAEFQELADYVLQHMDHESITQLTCRDVFLYLISQTE